MYKYNIILTPSLIYTMSPVDYCNLSGAATSLLRNVCNSVPDYSDACGRAAATFLAYSP